MSTASLLVPGASAPMLGHLVAMSGLHLQGRYGRMSDDFNRLAGRAPIDMRAFVQRYAAAFTRSPAD